MPLSLLHRCSTFTVHVTIRTHRLLHRATPPSVECEVALVRALCANNRVELALSRHLRLLLATPTIHALSDTQQLELDKQSSSPSREGSGMNRDCGSWEREEAGVGEMEGGRGYGEAWAVAGTGRAGGDLCPYDMSISTALLNSLCDLGEWTAVTQVRMEDTWWICCSCEWDVFVSFLGGFKVALA